MDPALLDPSLATATAPDRFTVALDTTRGPILIDVSRARAPLGADRLFNLVRIGFYDGAAFFRVVSGFVAQTGISADPAVSRAWKRALLRDDPVVGTNARGTVSFASAGRSTRTTQLFINLADNRRLDAMGFAPVGEVRAMDVADLLFAGYGESPPGGRGPMQGRLTREGAAYLDADFPELDRIRRATILEP